MYTAFDGRSEYPHRRRRRVKRVGTALLSTGGVALATGRSLVPESRRVDSNAPEAAR
jgi:hypothetical protein